MNSKQRAALKNLSDALLACKKSGLLLRGQGDQISAWCDLTYTNVEPGRDAVMVETYTMENGMADIVERLRNVKYAMLFDGWQSSTLTYEAATEIEALRRENQELRRTVQFVQLWAWRESPISDEERLSAIKFHPRVNPREQLDRIKPGERKEG